MQLIYWKSDVALFSVYWVSYSSNAEVTAAILGLVTKKTRHCVFHPAQEGLITLRIWEMKHTTTSDLSHGCVLHMHVISEQPADRLDVGSTTQDLTSFLLWVWSSLRFCPFPFTFYTAVWVCTHWQQCCSVILILPCTRTCSAAAPNAAQETLLQFRGLHKGDCLAGMHIHHSSLPHYIS